MDSVEVMSILWNQASPPSSAILLTTAKPFSSLLPQITTLAPSLAQSLAIPIPIPEVEPVTMTTFPSSLFIVSYSFFQHLFYQTAD